MPNALVGIALGIGVGVVLGLLGGGGSILALPIFLYVFDVEPKPAIAMSLAVVGMSSLVGALGHWRQGSINLRVGLPFGAIAMVAAFLTARVSDRVPAAVQLSLFALFAFSAAVVMLVDSFRPERHDRPAAATPQFTPMLGLESAGVGALTALIGAGGGFVIVPALVYLAGVPVRQAVGSSLLIITLNTLSGFLGYIGRQPIDWTLVGTFTGVVALGTIVGTRLNRRVPQRLIKRLFAVLILALGSYLVVKYLVVRGQRSEVRGTAVTRYRYPIPDTNPDA